MNKRLLIVDDDQAVRKYMRRALQGAEYEILDAGDGDEAVESIAARRPDLVLLDMHMPRFDGITALGAILDIDPGIAVIMVTGDDDAGRAALALGRGARDCLTKPFDLQTLRSSVKSHLSTDTPSAEAIAPGASGENV